MGRARKSEWSIELVGRFDETQVALGYVLGMCKEPPFDLLRPTIERTMAILFESATSSLGEAGIARAVIWLESEIDSLFEILPPLNGFVRPTGTELASRLHLARVAVRRLERGIWQAYDGEHWAPIEATPFINRLSDYLFVASRWANTLDEGAPSVQKGEADESKADDPSDG